MRSTLKKSEEVWSGRVFYYKIPSDMILLENNPGNFQVATNLGIFV